MLPAGVSTYTLRFGEPNGYTDATGSAALVGAEGYLLTVDPSTDEPINVKHAASGTIVPKRVPITIGSDGKGSVGPLAHNGQAGLSPAGWAYRVEWKIGTGKPSPGNLTFVVPSGATADFDLLVPAEDIPTISVPVYVSAQALIGLDTDGTPFFDPSGIGTPTGVALDTDGVPYLTVV